MKKINKGVIALAIVLVGVILTGLVVAAEPPGASGNMMKDCVASCRLSSEPMDDCVLSCVVENTAASPPASDLCLSPGSSIICTTTVPEVYSQCCGYTGVLKSSPSCPEPLQCYLNQELNCPPVSCWE